MSRIGWKGQLSVSWWFTFDAIGRTCCKRGENLNPAVHLFWCQERSLSTAALTCSRTIRAVRLRSRSHVLYSTCANTAREHHMSKAVWHKKYICAAYCMCVARVLAKQQHASGHWHADDAYEVLPADRLTLMFADLLLRRCRLQDISSHFRLQRTFSYKMAFGPDERYR